MNITENYTVNTVCYLLFATGTVRLVNSPTVRIASCQEYKLLFGAFRRLCRYDINVVCQNAKQK